MFISECCSNCFASPTLTSNMLMLFIYISGITKVAEPCPVSCNCYPAINSTLCSGKGLTQVPRDIPYYTVLLALSHNNIKRLQFGDFQGLPNLRMLYMENSNVHFIDIEMFSELKNLTVLDLEGNKLIKIPVFPDGMALLSLDLSGNLLKNIKSDSFSQLRSLRKLFLHGNLISHIEAGSFNPLKNLTTLSLKNNSLRYLASKLLSGLRQLKVLDLSCNHLTSLNATSLYGLVSLETLLLDMNRLYNVDSNAFLHLTSLKKLHIAQNNLSFLHYSTFMGLRKLDRVYMYGNAIPCSCQYLNLLKSMNAYLAADCRQSKNSSVGFHHDRKLRNVIEPSANWSNWTKIESTTGCSSSSSSPMIRMRICPDCARKKNHYHCSHYPRGEDFVCLFVHGRNSRYKPSHIANFSIPIFCQASCTDVRKTTMLLFIIIFVSLISISVISVTFCCAVKIHRLRSTAQQTRNIAHHDRRRHF